MNLKVSQLVMMVSGAIIFLFSWMPFYSQFGHSFNAWSSDAGTLFLATWPVLLGIAIAALSAARAFGNVEIPEVAGFKAEQIPFVLALPAFLIMVGFLLGGPDINKGFGFFLMFLGTLGLTAGSVLELLGIGGDLGGSSSTGGYGAGYGGGYPPQGPPQGPPPGGGYPPQGPPPGGGYPPQGPPQGPPSGSF